MRIGIDARFYGPESKGLGRYTQKLIENLEKVAGASDDFYIFLRKENWDDYTPTNPRFRKVLANFPWYSFSEQWRMPLLVSQYDLDLMHFPHFNVPLFCPRPFVVTIHDLILLHFPTLRTTTLSPFYYRFKFWVYKKVISSALKRARCILTVSQFTKEDILKNYSIPKEKISVIYEATDIPEENKVSLNGKVLDKYDIIKPYLLYVGNAYPHKNLENLLLAFKEVLKERLNLFLVLVGKKDYFYKRLHKEVKKLGLKKVIFTGQVNDQELEEIYQNAESYIFPSLYEGFGLPPLEAMARNVPVISSDHGSLKEILGENAYFFDARKPKNIARAVLEIIANEEKKNDLRKKGKQWVKRYSWFRAAGETLEAYYKAKK